MTPETLLSNLNQSQNAAVTSVADTLAILAGPGSGKTHTLTSRTAWLLAQGLQPWNVIVATFTVKAAREMKERIGKLIGNGMESKLILGTFHSIARRYLARYGHLIGVKNDFGIADTSDSAAILKRIIKRHRYIMDHKVARSRISSFKAKGAGYADDTKQPSKKSVESQEFEKIYAEYEEVLKVTNMLDYDDLLLRCVELLRNHPSCVSNVEAVLIDEFQDTNIVQFDLMRLFAAARKRITIVGDPDQSIYGFRAAEIKNYKRFLRQYPDTITIALEENYRSSGAILLSALQIIKQDTSRVDKSLQATHGIGTRPVLRKLYGAHQEAEWIVTEVQRCLGMMGDLLTLNDFAVLVRSAALSRLIESALGKAGIAYRMVGGLRFYDRLEIKLVLDYLRVISQPSSNDALARIINVPSRRIGESTIKALLEEADTSKVTLWRLVLDSVQGRRPIKTQIKKSTNQGLSELVNIILTGQKKMNGSTEESCNLKALIDHVLDKLDMENWLKKQHNDETGARWDNIQELINQANDFQDLLLCGYEDEALPEIEGMNQTETTDQLARFLANVALASEVRNDDQEAKPQLTISTIHAAKGLEWPVVFIPATYQGSIPHSRAEDTNEERRLLYVAMTRAKALLYMSYPMKNSQGEATTLSPFLTLETTKFLEAKGPSMQYTAVQSISKILRRACPNPQSIQQASLLLQSEEDDRFPVDGEEKEDRDLKWSLTQGSQTFSMGQQPAKRRKIEIGRAISDSSERVSSYVTTMTRVTTFTATNTTMGGFVSAGHLQVLDDESINANPEKTKKQTGGKQKMIEGQCTLFGFLGKPEPSLPASKRQPHAFSPPANRPDFIQRTVSTATIDPSLANHRLESRANFKPKVPHIPQQHQQDEYVFLSSSPPRPPPALSMQESVPDRSTVLCSKADILSKIRPPSMHMTSQDLVNSDGPKKSLGMRRSMHAGWKGTKFKPPTMRRPES